MRWIVVLQSLHLIWYNSYLIWSRVRGIEFRKELVSSASSGDTWGFISAAER